MPNKENPACAEPLTAAEVVVVLMANRGTFFLLAKPVKNPANKKNVPLLASFLEILNVYW